VALLCVAPLDVQGFVSFYVQLSVRLFTSAYLAMQTAKMSIHQRERDGTTSHCCIFVKTRQDWITKCTSLSVLWKTLAFAPVCLCLCPL